MSILDFTLIKNGSLYHILSLPQILHVIPLFLITLSQNMKNSLILYFIMLKNFHLYLMYMGTTADNINFIKLLSSRLIRYGEED